MLTVRKKGIVEDRYLFNRGDEEIARLRTGVWPRKGTIEIGAETYRFYREGYFGGQFVFEKEGVQLAGARKPRALRDHFVVMVGLLSFEMTREERFNSAMTLWWNDEVIGRIGEGRNKVHAIVDLPDSLPPEFQVFFFALAQILWDRHAILNALGG